MSISVIFFFGLFVFFVFIIGILLNAKESKDKLSNRIETDTVDYDGSGNYGRVPDKKAKNRAI